ncbi:conserved hypothetical protein [Verticillium alfalfae VaMs.102]|uniref:Uncharacterized protein n=1 Tax=Verticillium alfalfae (strain VaMs.102 / ATCC MYA-4576 / FGSC 10136) TaxID=526221 RepID=C9S8A5_VERA1|nr:conserved hypothetical protein [Verticillium alfalfae VaMs.102]EEY13915.1 conserved hypothetical protein [Verticillium alfalfae VaMs.102]
MAGEIERLIEWLIDDISCHGDRGYPVSQTLATIQDYHHGTARHDTPSAIMPATAGLNDATTDQSLLSSMWDWIRERDDISIGENRQWNHLTLEAVLAMPEPEAFPSPGQVDNALESFTTVPQSPKYHEGGQVNQLRAGETLVAAFRPRIYASADRMWESIAGHSADFKRVPRLEWAALVGIATTKSDGILQGDLCRLIGQDKRSLPKRTDSLAQKGYITKRTTLVRGVKTSKMWLRRLAPSMPTNPTQTGRGERTSVNWCREALTADMEPVAWCDRWTGKSIDTHMLAKTAIEIIKAWKIIRYDDLRRKLGIEGLKWQMKTQARLCRWMVRRGIVQYVAATLGERLFKDCLKFNRDFSADDWDSYLATGKVKARTNPETEDLAQYREANLDTPNRSSSISGSRDRHTTAGRTTSTRGGIACQDQWKPEKPLPTTVMDVIRAGDARGVPNRQIGKHTMGPPFTRYVSSISTTLATPALQPSHLTHFQVSSQLHRVEKSAIYLFSLPQLPDYRRNNTIVQAHFHVPDSFSAAEDLVDGPHAQQYKGFSVPTQHDLSDQFHGLSALARVPSERRQWKSIRIAPQEMSHTQPELHKQSRVSTTPARLTHDDDTNLTPTISTPCHSIRISDEMPGTAASCPVDIDDLGSQNVRPTRRSLIVSLKVRPSALSRLLALPSSPRLRKIPDLIANSHTPSFDEVNRQSLDGSHFGNLKMAEESESGSSNRVTINCPDGRSSEPTQLSDKTESLQPSTSLATKRGRSKAKSTKTSKQQKKGNKAGIFICEKCGGVWKNDNGLKYHLEKSASSCNAAYVPPTPKAHQFQAKAARLSTQESLGGNTPILERSARSARITGNRDSSAQLVQDTAVNLAHRNTLQAHASVLLARTHRRRRTSAESCAAQVDMLLGRPSPTADSSDATALGSSKWYVRPGADRGIRLKAPVTPRKSDYFGVAGLTSTETASIAPSNQNGQIRHQLREPRKRPQLVTFAVGEQDTHTGYRNTTESRPPPYSSSPAHIDLSNARKHTHEVKRTEISTVEAGGETLRYPKFCMPTIADEQDTNGYAPDSRLHRASQIMLYLIQNNDGVFPGDRSAYLAFLSVWERTFPSDPPPSNNNVQVAINKLVSRKKIIKTTHAFRDVKGAFKSANVLLARGMDPFCPAAVAVKERIIAEHPRPYILAEFTPSAEMFGQDQKMWKGEPIFSNRRKLENDVGVLDAPFYVNESLKKRKPKGVEADDASPSKRHRPDSGASAGIDSSGNEPMVGTIGRPSQAAGASPYIPTHHVAALKHQAAYPELTFLEPNTCLDEDDEPSHILPTARDVQQHIGMFSGEEINQSFSHFDFTAARKILQYGTEWPLLEVNFFEQNNSFAMDGWMPDSQWFLQCGLPHSLDEMISAESNGKEDQHDGSEADFMKQVNGCRRWEVSFEAKSLVALGSIAPNYIFINHRMDTHVEWHVQTLLWSPENQLGFRGSHIDTDQPDSDLKAEIQQLKRRKYTPRTRSRLEPTVQMDMKYRTLLPWSRSSGAEAEMLEGQTLDGEDDAVVIAAFVATRTLLGGADKYIEWGLMMRLFPSRSLAFLRKFWSKTRRDRPASVKQLTERFQKRFIAAYERNEIPSLDFDNYVRYDWVNLIRWTASLVEDSVTLPSGRADLEQHFTLEDAVADVHDWQEDYYNVQSSIYSRLEAVTSKSAVVLLNEDRKSTVQEPDLVKAKTWIRSLCSTQQGLYTPQQTRVKMASLTDNGEVYNNELLERAIDTLQGQNVIARTRRRRYENRSYRLSEWYLPRLAKQSHEQKFLDAVAFKTLLDAKFRRDEEVRIPYVIRDGEVMAMINLQAHGRVTISPVDMPQIPLGFKPGVYESRKFPKTFYNFGLQITPTPTYVYDDDIYVLQQSQGDCPASQSAEGALPLWSDFFGALKVDRWRQVLGAVVFAIAMRGPLDLKGVVATLKPNLEDFEVQLVIEWALRNEVLKTASPRGASYTTAEWWWLIVGSQGVLKGS